MTNEEKYQLIADSLKDQHDTIKWMTEEQLLSYVELMIRFFQTNDTIFMQASLSTMYLIAKNARYNGEYEKGRNEAIKEMGKKLLQLGKSIEDISEITRLSEEDLQNLLY